MNEMNEMNERKNLFFTNLQNIYDTKDLSKFRLNSKKRNADEEGIPRVTCLCEMKNIKFFHTSIFLENNDEFIVGWCCAKRFGIKRKCIKCNTLIKKWVDGYCKDCRIIVKKEEEQHKKIKEIEQLIIQQKNDEIEKFAQSYVKFGKYKGKNKKWVDILHNDFNWCQFVYNQDWFTDKNKYSDLREREVQKLKNK